DLCAARALGGIGEADRIELEQHLAEGCPVCERAMAEMSQGLVVLAASAPAATPSPRLKEVVLARVRAEAAASPRGVRSGAEGDPARAESRPLHPAGPGEGPQRRGRVIDLPGRARTPWPTWGLAAAAVVLAVSAVAAWRAAGVLRGELSEARARIAG